MPGHLDRFQFGLVGLGGIVFEAGEFSHIFVQISEADCERINFRMSLRQQDSDIFRVAPGKFLGMGKTPVKGNSSKECLRLQIGRSSCFS